MATTVDLSSPFSGVLQALDLKDQRKAMRTAMRGESKRLKKIAEANLLSSGIGRGKNQKLSRGIWARVYPERFGMGFMISAKPRKNGKSGYHTNRKGQEKPVLMWAEEGTKLRKTKSKTKAFIRRRKGHYTGRMRRYGFISKTERQIGQSVEQNLFRDFQKNLEKAAREKGLL